MTEEVAELLQRFEKHDEDHTDAGNSVDFQEDPVGHHGGLWIAPCLHDETNHCCHNENDLGYRGDHDFFCLKNDPCCDFHGCVHLLCDPEFRSSRH